MKILIASFTFPPNKDGVAEAAAMGARAFLEKGWDVEVVTEPTMPPRPSSQWGGARIHEFAIYGGPYFRHPYQGQIGQYQNFLRSGNWDVIIFHAYLWPLHLAVPLLDLLPAKKVLVSHGYGALKWTPVSKFPFGLMAWGNSIWLSLQMLSWIRKIDRWVFLSPKKDLRGFFDHWLADRTAHPGITIIPNGVETLGLQRSPGSFRKAHGIPSNVPFFLCIANYSRRKDQGYAMRAFRQAAIPGSHLVFIGSEFNDSSKQFQTEDAAVALSGPPGKIHWLQSISREDTLEALAECDVFVLSSNHEGQPIVLLEAMSLAKPWVARQAGCIAELPGGICVRTEWRMARSMQKLAKDPEERSRLGDAGSKAVKYHFSREKYDRNFCRLVSGLVPEQR